MVFTNEGLLLRADKEGIIKEILFNNISEEIASYKNKLFVDLFIKEGIKKALDFIVEVKRSSATFGWELILKPEFSAEPLHFGGALIENDITIFGSFIKVDFEKFLSGLMLINNEQTNKIRAITKEVHQIEEIKQNKNDYFFDELSRLNNELVGMQRELAKKNMELADLNKLKNQFLGMAAHDLRNPLGNIFTYSEFMEEEKENLSGEQIEFLGYIKSQSSYMLKLVTDLLDVTAIESGKIILSVENVDIIELVTQNIELNRLIAEKKNINVSVCTDIKSLSINIDPGKIEQVITNLFTNAVKFSPRQTEILISIEENTEDLIISVKDRGQGIPEEELGLLFQPFQRTSSKTTGGEKSTGLGLFIAKKIVEAHYGKIWVESKFGEGCTFFISLPLTTET